MILITGSTGHFGEETIDFLLQKGIAASQIAALAKTAEKARGLKAKGIQAVIGNYDDYASLLAAFKGVDKLLFVSSSDIIHRVAQQENVVRAAKEAGVKHVVYTSFARKNDTSSSPIALVAEAHLKTEKWLKESGLFYTIFKNNIYLEYVPVFIGPKVLETGLISLPAGEGKAAFALRKEMAEAAANVLTSAGHEGKTYGITNVEAYSYRDVASLLSGVTGKKIDYVSPAVEEFIKALTDAGVPKEYAGISAGFSLALAQGEFDVTGKDLEILLGRRPISLKAFLQEFYGSK
jgi:NAD(P)H dehydrogenase (quinone)